MSLYEHIQQDYLHAFKNKLGIKKDILGYVFAQLKNQAIDLQRTPHDDEIIQLIKKEIKSRQEAISYAEQTGKEADKAIDLEKITILETYLPTQLTEQQLRELIDTTRQRLNITDLKTQRGQLIGAIMASHGTQVDGKLLNNLISSL